jgi:hypothetical protein
MTTKNPTPESEVEKILRLYAAWVRGNKLNNGIDVNKATQQINRLILEARKDQIYRIRNLANELSFEDETMKGAEKLRNYHYTTAMDKELRELESKS